MSRSDRVTSPCIPVPLDTLHAPCRILPAALECPLAVAVGPAVRQRRSACDSGRAQPQRLPQLPPQRRHLPFRQQQHRARLRVHPRRESYLWRSSQVSRSLVAVAAWMDQNLFGVPPIGYRLPRRFFAAAAIVPWRDRHIAWHSLVRPTRCSGQAITRSSSSSIAPQDLPVESRGTATLILSPFRREMPLLRHRVSLTRRASTTP